MAAIHSAGFQILEQLCYSPDLALTDYFLLPKLKEHFWRIHFWDNGEVMGTRTVNEWLAKRQQFFAEVFQHLRDYVEK